MDHRDYRKDFAAQTVLESPAGTYTARCPICGAELDMKRKWWTRQGAVLDALILHFNRCPRCGRWVCDDCFLAGSGGDSMGICRDCAAGEEPPDGPTQ
ncbi:MAG: hypothetical protein LBH70_04010 [Spirochaetaceae bacterium]|jgi:transcription elongation factor Elf1|nr:hypothetical protein [Spirochaetaceae bacterium]